MIHIQTVSAAALLAVKYQPNIFASVIYAPHLFIQQFFRSADRLLRAAEKHNPVIGHSKNGLIVKKSCKRHHRVNIIIAAHIIVRIVLSHRSKIIKGNACFHMSAVYVQIRDAHKFTAR